MTGTSSAVGQASPAQALMIGLRIYSPLIPKGQANSVLDPIEKKCHHFQVLNPSIQTEGGDG